jgi:Ca2+-transporting ATPase
MTTLHREGVGSIALVKGAPERVLPKCASGFEAGTMPHGEKYDEALAAADGLAAQGLRVLAVACRRWPGAPDTPLDSIETDLVFLGLVGLSDPPRPEAADAVALCRSAGITPVMVTGDHPDTAVAIARAVGIMEPGGEVVTGRELAAIGPDRLAEQVKRVRVFARVAPEQKLAIVTALQRGGERVAMTGDGVNDAPALIRADIGIAMGRHGTDVAREAADLVLLDDNFATLVVAVRGGRRVYENIRKFIRFVLAGNVGEILTLVLAPLFGLPVPLLPIHILWINLVSDGGLGLALAVEPEEPGVMHQPPRPPGESVFARGLWQHVLWVGVLIGVVSLAAQAWGWHGGSSRWRTMAFTTLALAQIAQVLAVRSERASVFRLRTRWWLGDTLGLQVAALHHPLGQAVLRVDPLSGGELAACFGLGSVVFIAMELEKCAARRGWLGALRSG